VRKRRQEIQSERVAKKCGIREDNHDGIQNVSCHSGKCHIKNKILFKDFQYDLHTLLAYAVTRAAALTRALELDSPEL
jgi:hypothetical protein